MCVAFSKIGIRFHFLSKILIFSKTLTFENTQVSDVENRIIYKNESLLFLVEETSNSKIRFTE